MRYIVFTSFDNDDGWLKIEAILSGMNLAYQYIPDNLRGWAYLVECEEEDLVVIKIKDHLVSPLPKGWYRDEHFEFLKEDWDLLRQKYERR